MRESIKMGKKMEKELMPGLMGVTMLENGFKIRFMAMVSMFGGMEGHLRVIGNIIKCMVLEFIHGRMVESMKDTISMIKNMDMVSMHGRMEDHLRGSGLMENDREKEN